MQDGYLQQAYSLGIIKDNGRIGTNKAVLIQDSLYPERWWSYRLSDLPKTLEGLLNFYPKMWKKTFLYRFPELTQEQFYIDYCLALKPEWPELKKLLDIGKIYPIVIRNQCQLSVQDGKFPDRRWNVEYKNIINIEDLWNYIPKAYNATYKSFISKEQFFFDYQAPKYFCEARDLGIMKYENNSLYVKDYLYGRWWKIFKNNNRLNSLEEIKHFIPKEWRNTYLSIIDRETYAYDYFIKLHPRFSEIDKAIKAGVCKIFINNNKTKLKFKDYLDRWWIVPFDNLPEDMLHYNPKMWKNSYIKQHSDLTREKFYIDYTLKLLPFWPKLNEMLNNYTAKVSVVNKQMVLMIKDSLIPNTWWSIQKPQNLPADIDLENYHAKKYDIRSGVSESDYVLYLLENPALLKARELGLVKVNDLKIFIKDALYPKRWWNVNKQYAKRLTLEEIKNYIPRIYNQDYPMSRKQFYIDYTLSQLNNWPTIKQGLKSGLLTLNIFGDFLYLILHNEKDHNWIIRRPEDLPNNIEDLKKYKPSSIIANSKIQQELNPGLTLKEVYIEYTLKENKNSELLFQELENGNLSICYGEKSGHYLRYTDKNGYSGNIKNPDMFEDIYNNGFSHCFVYYTHEDIINRINNFEGDLKAYKTELNRIRNLKNCTDEDIARLNEIAISLGVDITITSNEISRDDILATIDSFTGNYYTYKREYNRIKSLKNSTPEDLEKLNEIAHTLGIPLTRREAFYQSKLSLATFNGETATIEDIDVLKGVPGVWAIHTSNGCIDVCQTKDIGNEILLALRRRENLLNPEIDTNSKSWAEKYSEWTEDTDFILVARDIKDQTEREKIEIQYAHDNQAKFWCPAPGQQQIIQDAINNNNC